MRPDDDSDEPIPQGRLDPTTLRTMGRRAESHPLTESWQFQPDASTPRYLELSFDADTYPEAIQSARLDVSWFVTDDYYLHYVETHGRKTYQCRWDRHLKADSPRTHFHPPPDAGPAVESPLEPHHLEGLFTVLDWVSERVEALHS